jgi:hypothetical protein
VHTLLDKQFPARTLKSEKQLQEQRRERGLSAWKEGIRLDRGRWPSLVTER